MGCLRPCEGLFVDVKRSQASTIQEAKLQILRNEYTNYTSFQESYNTEKKMIMELQHEPELRFVRIYFSAPTFDRITIDSRVKFVDILSAIGGTMGLLTGFSIISGVEIIYFTMKILGSCLQKKLKKEFVIHID